MPETMNEVAVATRKVRILVVMSFSFLPKVMCMVKKYTGFGELRTSCKLHGIAV